MQLVQKQYFRQVFHAVCGQLVICCFIVGLTIEGQADEVERDRISQPNDPTAATADDSSPPPEFPTWWVEKGVTSSTPHKVNNYAVGNLGQLKHFALRAMEHMDEYLPGGAGEAIHTMVEGFARFDSENPQANYRVVNLGQTKNVAEAFYRRLESVGYVRFEAGWRPWDPSTPKEKNYAVCNLGQIKNVFSWDLSKGEFDSDGNGILECEQDDDGDGISNFDEWLLQRELERAAKDQTEAVATANAATTENAAIENEEIDPKSTNLSHE